MCRASNEGGQSEQTAQLLIQSRPSLFISFLITAIIGSYLAMPQNVGHSWVLEMGGTLAPRTSTELWPKVVCSAKISKIQVLH